MILDGLKTPVRATVPLVMTKEPAARATAAEDPEPPAELSPYLQCWHCRGTGGDSAAGQCRACRGSGSVRRPRFKQDEVTLDAQNALYDALTGLYKGYADDVDMAIKAERADKIKKTRVFDQDWPKRRD